MVAKRRTLSLEMTNAGAFIVSTVGAAPEAPPETRRHGPAGVLGTIAEPREGLPGNLGDPVPSVSGTAGRGRASVNNPDPGPERCPAAAPGARERRHEHAGAHGTGRRNNKPTGSGIGGRSAFIVLLRTGNRSHRDPGEGREASHGRPTGGKRWRRHRTSQTRPRNSSG